MALMCRGVRGATTVESNDRQEILDRTEELLRQMIESNGIEPEHVGSVIFTTTPDVNAEYPALAARKLGWYDQALLCGHEMNVPGGLQNCIRILIHWNTTKDIHEIQHTYINGAEVLRPEHAVE
ncbi:MAG TPA: chorismate mutase [bacterium]|nr:chorismate mutase [bacterium]